MVNFIFVWILCFLVIGYGGAIHQKLEFQSNAKIEIDNGRLFLQIMFDKIDRINA